MHEVSSLWIGKKLSPINVISINSFLHHGFNYNLYLYGKVDNIPDGVNILDGNEIIDESEIFYYKKGFSKESPAGFACLFRYILLYERAGTWVDLDMVLLKDFKFNDDYVFVQQSLPNSSSFLVNVNLIHTKNKNKPIFKDCINEIENVDKDSIRHGDIGPVLFDYKVREFDLKNYVKPTEEFCSINWDELYKFFDDSVLSEESIGLHLWQSRWKPDGFDEYKEYDKNCIYENLKEKYL